jgi:hypothetical protein
MIPPSPSQHAANMHGNWTTCSELFDQQTVGRARPVELMHSVFRGELLTSEEKVITGAGLVIVGG